MEKPTKNLPSRLKLLLNLVFVGFWIWGVYVSVSGASSDNPPPPFFFWSLDVFILLLGGEMLFYPHQFQKWELESYRFDLSREWRKSPFYPTQLRIFGVVFILFALFNIFLLSTGQLVNHTQKTKIATSTNR